MLATEEPFEVKVAMLQMVACNTSTECMATAESEIRKAASAGADIALTPEMWSVGYASQFPKGQIGVDGWSRDQIKEAYAWTKLSQTVQGVYISKLKSLAVELDIAIAAGMMRRDSGLCGTTCDDGGKTTSTSGIFAPPRNSVVLIDRHGNQVYAYDKVHTCVWGADEAMTTPGREFFTGVLNTKRGDLTVGSMICKLTCRFPVEVVAGLGM
jgi:N-carbamoylputrescine amidase